MRNLYIAIALVVLGLTAKYFWPEKVTNSSGMETSLPDVEGGIEITTKKPLLEESQPSVTDDQPLDIELDPAKYIRWNADRGYFDPNEHSYIIYDIETLNQLVQNGDGLASLFLADQLVVDKESEGRVEDLYIEAATHGYSTALVKLGVFKLGEKSYRRGKVPQQNSNGELSQQYIDGLKYLAAAELSGDPLMDTAFSYHVKDIPADVLAEAMPLICEEGRAIALTIDTQREAQGMRPLSRDDFIFELAIKELGYVPRCINQ